MGAVDDRFALALFGFVVASGALSLRWWQIQRTPLRLQEQAAIVYPHEEYPQAEYLPLPPEHRQGDSFPSLYDVQAYPPRSRPQMGYSAWEDQPEARGKNDRQAITGDESTP